MWGPQTEPDSRGSARVLVPYLRPFPVWKLWEVEVGVWRWCPDWYGQRVYRSQAEALAAERGRV